MIPAPNGATSPAARTKVAILGGGPGGISAAFWLSATPALRAKFEVAVYTQGWRIGGKCATGRNMAIDARIEEHGLHILMGCYTDAFRMIRACYDEWQPRPGGPFQHWTDAFTAQRQVSLQQPVDGSSPPSWATWNFVLPKLPGEPGDPVATPTPVPTGTAPASPNASAAPVSTLEPLVVALSAWLADHLQNSIPPELVHSVDHQTAVQRFGKLIGREIEDDVDDVRRSLEDVAAEIRGHLSVTPLAATTAAAAPAGAPSPGTICPLACKLALADLGLSVAIGWARDIFLFGDAGIDRINAKDFREWLRSCGATDTALASAPIRALYDLTFAFRDGDSSSIDHGSIAAGVTLRFMLEAVLGYKDAPLWKMNAGTGDTVFTPLYQVLRARGVEINFFTRVTQLALTSDASRIGTITVDEQAMVPSGAYQPFVVVGNLDCWPNEPLWGQLANGAALRAQGVDFESPTDTTAASTRQLALGRDFDIAVLAMPPDVIKVVAPLGPPNGPWQTMLANSASVAPEAFQLWLRPDLAHLGWTLGPTVLTAYAEPFDSWADMSHLLPYEAWSGPYAPQSLEYFCGCVPTPKGPPPDPRQDAEAWLAGSIATLWPGAAGKGGPIDPSALVSGYYRSNLDGSERYVQTPADTVRFRLSPRTPVFGNLYLAGDWTLTRFSGGCFESAIESGVLAASAIAGGP
jgi:uncharacterized protein with NAD-binding domain and iron-sulfur cluster